MNLTVSSLFVLSLTPLALAWWGESKIEVEPPPTATGTSQGPEEKVSQLRIPIAVSLETLRQYGEAAVPPAASGSKGLRNFGPAAENRISWNLTRAPLALSGGDGRLSIATSISGTATVSGKIQPIRGDIGKILGKLKVKPSQPYSQTAKVGADVSASAAPRLQADWGIAPNLSGKAVVREASARIAGIFDLSFRGELQDDVDRAVNNALADLTAQIASDRTLKAKAAEAWGRLCQPIAVSPGEGLPDLSLRVAPRGFAASQPVIDAGGVRADLGLDAVVRLVAAEEPAEACPSFNESLAIAEASGGVSAVALRADLSYEALNRALEALRARQPKVSGPGVEAELARVTLGPLGDRLLVAVDGRFSETSWFGASATGTIYLAATPRLDAAAQTLGFEAVSVDAASREALGTVAAALGNALSPLLEARLDDLSIDLKPEIEKARTAAAAAAATLKEGRAPVRFSEAALDELRLGQLWHDEAGLHLAIEASGRLSLEAIDIVP